MESSTPAPSQRRRRRSTIRRLLRHLTPQSRGHHHDTHSAPSVPLGTRLVNHLRRRSGPVTPGRIMTAPPAYPPPHLSPAMNIRGCIICCADAAELDHPLIRPCTSCAYRFCAPCLGKQFTLLASDHEDVAFPPDCACGRIIPLHAAKPYLDEQKQAKYRARFDVWSSTFPLYCPVPTCSAFVHDRCIPTTALSPDGSRLVENLIISCPNGHRFCSTCRQDHKAGTPCPAEGDYAVTTATVEAAIKQWGYKKCPKCRTGVKRMGGCSHIMCRCGAHWCWLCERGITQCDQQGRCGDVDDDYDYYSDEHSDVDPGEATANANGTQDARPRRPAPAPNLDALHLDANRNLDLNGEPPEPQGGVFGRCAHYFEIYNAPGESSTEAPSNTSKQHKAEIVPTKDMECHRCWTPIADLADMLDAIAGIALPKQDHDAICKDIKQTMNQLFDRRRFHEQDEHKLTRLIRNSLPGRDEHEQPHSLRNTEKPANAPAAAFRCAESDCGLLVCNDCAITLARRIKFEQDAADAESVRTSEAGPDENEDDDENDDNDGEDADTIMSDAPGHTGSARAQTAQDVVEHPPPPIIFCPMISG